MSTTDALDEALLPHLRLEPTEEVMAQYKERRLQEVNRARQAKEKPFSRPTVNQTTIETDNKKRPGILKRNSERYAPPLPEEPDPNSEAKSLVIKKLHSNLEVWERQLEELTNKKKEQDELHKSEIEKRDNEITGLKSNLSEEMKQRTQAETNNKELSEKLNFTEMKLAEQTHNAEQLSVNLMHYEALYQQTEGQRSELEEENGELMRKVAMIEDMKRRLNDQVTDLQGQVAILERRSAICTIL
ncbi:PREDICTED: uncharacterized protein LOC109580679 [Amphimedon queenslandica]|nr:PREDICTED: uncharacterized protein LOC109580679 [Amphimedon queenslandica]|eukprot:XP_019849678.1 PREDICTED: uncharacterized protein LOC109580679 [Amphimedon queenslandica]